MYGEFYCNDERCCRGYISTLNSLPKRSVAVIVISLFCDVG